MQRRLVRRDWREVLFSGGLADAAGFDVEPGDVTTYWCRAPKADLYLASPSKYETTGPLLL